MDRGHTNNKDLVGISDIVFVASARDYHAIDWYRLVKELCPKRSVYVATDLVEGEGFDRIVTAEDKVVVLFPNDMFLFRDQSFYGNIWRNIVKILTLPVIALRLNALKKMNVGTVFHAHSMYYIFLCWAARIKFIATPMGSDVLVRPDRSRIYRYFTIKALRAASAITVDSAALQDKVAQLCGAPSFVVQNGIDSSATAQYREYAGVRSRVVSMRGCDQNYRIADLVRARNGGKLKPSLDLIYPFYEKEYRDMVKAELLESDADHGRVNKEQMYRLFSEAKLAVSVPVSDSSPRSVYEAIFCGACVAVSYGRWIEALPGCMRSRLYIADLENPKWFDEAIAFADQLAGIPYQPSTEAISQYDEKEAMSTVCRMFYGEPAAV